jgi:SPOR domain
MSTETHKYAAPAESEPRHSAFEEFSRDERRPAVLLLAGLLIAATFFAIGILVGRWSAATVGSQPITSPGAATKQQPQPAPSNLTPTPQPTPALAASARTNQSSNDPERRFSILVATYNTPEDAQPLIKGLERAGYTDIRTVAPRADDSRAKFSVMVGRYTRDEAREAAARLRATDNPKLKNARVVENGG